MVSNAFKDSLLEVYHGEQFGEAFFSTLLQHAENNEQSGILGALLQLETEGKVKLRPLLARLGLPLNDDAKSIARGISMAETMLNTPWTEKFSAMADGIKAHGLPQYEALVDMVAADDDAEAHQVASFIGAHERVILKVCENIVSGEPDPASPLATFLDFPLTLPSAT